MKYLILGNSLTYGPRVRVANTVSIPGLNWEGAQKYLLDNRGSLHNTYVYVVVGPVRFTSMHQSRKEVAFLEPQNSVHQIFHVFYTELKHLNIRPVICTIYPMIFSVYNRLKATHPIMTSFYTEWNDKIKRYCVVENREICYFNKKWGNQTPYLHRRLFHRHNLMYALRATLLTDGLHPQAVIKSEWAREIRRLIKNTQ